MSKTIIAKLQWIGPEDGGRPTPPLGPKYSTVARFDAQKDQWLKDAWSLVVTFLEKPDALRTHRVEVTFLAEKAPEHLLAKGSGFELMEGARAVARGTVISDWTAGE